jgi:hypothetical protein
MPLFELFWPAPGAGWEEAPGSPVEAVDTEAAVRAVGRPVNSYRVREAGSNDWGDRFDIFAKGDGIDVRRQPPRLEFAPAIGGDLLRPCDGCRTLHGLVRVPGRLRWASHIRHPPSRLWSVPRRAETAREGEGLACWRNLLLSPRSEIPERSRPGLRRLAHPAQLRVAWRTAEPSVAEEPQRLRPRE